LHPTVRLHPGSTVRAVNATCMASRLEVGRKARKAYYFVHLAV